MLLQCNYASVIKKNHLIVTKTGMNYSFLKIGFVIEVVNPSYAEKYPTVKSQLTVTTFLCTFGRRGKGTDIYLIITYSYICNKQMF